MTHSYSRFMRVVRLLTAVTLMLSVMPLGAVVAEPGTSDQTTQVAQAWMVRDAAQPDRLAAAPAAVPPLAPDAVSLSATKRDALTHDVDSDGRADPGDALRYTVVIANSGDTDATNVVFNDTLDDNTVLSGTLKSTPLARNDAYTAVGNVRISLAVGGGVLVNDNDPDGSAISVVSASTTSTNGGNVDVNADGSFTYNPPAGYEGTDTFTYTIQDADGNQDSATVSVTVSGMIWFINNNAGACISGCDGRLTSPFATLAAFAAVNTGTGNNPAANDNIFVYESTMAYANGLTLLNGQRFIGQDSTSSLVVLTGVTPPAYSDALPAMNTGAPAVTINGGTNAVTLAQNNALYGFTSGTATGPSISGSNFGTLLVNDVIINTTGAGLSLNTGTFGSPATFTSITSSGGSNNVSLTGVAGTANLGGGALSGASSHAFVVDSGTAVLTFNGTINNTTARSVSVVNKTGGSVTYTGAVNGTAQGVFLNSNTGATITFAGGLSLNTGANAAFTATGGGTVNVCDENPCNPAATGALVNTLTTTTATALNVTNTTIGANSLEFRSINVDGNDSAPVNGIVLNSTGSLGRLIVKGTGSAGSGGTLQDNAGDAVLLTNTSNVSLSYMNFTSNLGSGIRGTSVNGFVLDNSSVTNNGNDTAVDESGIELIDLSGTASGGANPTRITNSTISNNYEFELQVTNSSGTLTDFQMSGNTISSNGATGVHGNLVNFLALGTATMKLTVTSGTFTGAAPATATGIQCDHSGNSGTMTCNVSGATFTNNNVAVSVSQANGGNLKFTVSGNTATGNRSHGLNLFVAATGSGTVDGAFTNNIVGTQGVAGSGSSLGYGIRVQNEGISTGRSVNVLINGNTVQETASFSLINVFQGIAGQTSSSATNATITGNTLRNSAARAIVVQQNNTTDADSAGSTCVDIAGNAMSNIPGQVGDGTYLRLRRLDANSGAGDTFRVRQTSLADLAAQNSIGTAQISVGGTMTYNGGACTPPSVMSPAGNQAVVQKQIESEPMFRVPVASVAATAPAAGGNSKPMLSLPFNSAFVPWADRAVEVDRVAAPIAPFTIGTLPAGKTITLTFEAVINNPVPDGVLQVSNQGTVTADGGLSVVTDDPDTVAASDPTVTALDIQADIQLLSKSDGALTATPGQQFGYTLTYTNAGPQSAANVTLTETVPANTTYTGSGWTCTPNNDAGSVCTINVGNVAINTGGSTIFTVTVINPVPTGVTQLSNSASISTSVLDPDPGNNAASDTTPIEAAPDLVLAKTDGAVSATPGGTIAYTLIYTNAGNQDVAGVVLTETVPANTAFNAGASSAGWTCAPDNTAGSVCTLTVGALAGGNASSSRTFAVTVANPVAAGVTQISNTASVADDGSNGADPTPANNTTSDTTPVDAAPDLTITKTDGGTSTTPGGTVTYTLNYANAGDQAATSVTLSDTIPANTSFDAGASTAGWSCLPDTTAGSLCTLSIGSLAGGGANGSATFVVTVDSPIPAGVTQLSNTASINDDGSNGADTTPADNTAGDTTPVTAAPDLQLTKSDGGARGIPNGTVAYTLAFVNTGNQGATGVTLTDTVPVSATFNAAASAAGWSCADGAPSGTACSLVIGSVVGGGNGSRVFAVTTDGLFPLTESAITNTATIADDGTNGADATPGNNTATDSTPIDTVPDLTIAKTHTGNFTKGQVGTTYTISVSNVGGLPTSDTVTVTDALPIGLTATGLSGSGWACDLGTLTCTRSDVLNASASYPDITLIVDVAVNTSSVLTNTATVFGGGEANPANNTTADVTTLDKAASTTALTSSPNPSVFGQTAIFTATVTSAVGTPTGSVTFVDGAMTLGSGILSGGVATFSTSSLLVGSHTITATYNGDADFNTSVDTTTQIVNKADSTTTLTSAPNPAVLGQSVTFTATVTASAPGAGTPTGVVTFTEGAVTLGTGTLSGGVATFSTSALSVGLHTVSATYDGDSNFNTSSDAATQTVNQANASTALTSAPNPSVFGQAVTFTATVTSLAGTPTGVVTFTEGAATLGTGTLDVNGVATLSISSLAVGTHAITATYGGDVNFTASTSNQVDQVVEQANTSIALASAANPSVFGQSVTITATVVANAPGSGTPTGSVTFFDNGTSIGSGTLSGGVVTFSTTSLTVGTHPITATYSGSVSFIGSTAAVLNQVVNRSGTNTVLASNPNPSVFGQTVTFTATVTASAPGAGTPTGSVTFFDGGTSLGLGPLSGGVATLNTASLTVGAHSITATYNGNTDFASSDATALNQVVNRADTTTTVTSEPNPSLPGQTIYFTATVGAVSPGAGTPAGNVTFYDDGVSIGSGALAGGVAMFNTAALAVGTHPITATYAGNVSFNGSTSPSYPQTVNAADTGTTLTSNPNPTVFGQAVTFAATVTATFGTPTGSVTFFDNGASLGTSALSGGVAVFSTASLAVGAHPITATYTGSVNFNPSSANQIDQVVDQANTSTTLNSTPNPAVFGQAVNFTATVTANAPGNGTPTGSVIFFDNGVSIGSGTLSGGVATFSTTSLTVGTHPITATYGGEVSFIVSTSGRVDQVVEQANTSTVLNSTPNPSVFGQSVTFTVTVTANAPGSGTPTGSVTFFDNGTSIGSGTLAGGVATLSAASLSVGTHPITATYSGDTNFVGSTASILNQVIDQADTNTTLASALNPSSYGQAVTFTATVSASAPGAGLPTGSVMFFADGVSLGSAALSGGVSTLTTAALTAGTRAITATYSGDVNFIGSTASTLNQVVNQASTATALTSNPNPSIFGQAVTLTATVTSSGGTPTGSVTFYDGAASLGTVNLSGGVATLTTSAFTAGSHALIAQSSGDANFTGSTSITITHLVDKATAAVTLGDLNQVYDGTPRPITATTNPIGLVVTFTYDGGSTPPVNAGSYAVVGTISDTNYAGTNSGTLLVAPAPLTVTANNASKTYGDVNPVFSVSYAGFQASDNATSLTVQPTATTTATTLTPVGVYAITPGGGLANNYAFTYLTGTLTISTAPLTVTANDQSRAYGAANPPLTVSYAGFKGSDDATSLTVQPVATTTATVLSPIGAYPITVSGGASHNYTFAYESGTLTITRATLTITADDQTRFYGEANPTLTASYSGFVNGETSAVLTGSPVLTTSADVNSLVGAYPITITTGTLTAANYGFNLVAGMLHVVDTPITNVTAVNDSPTVIGSSTVFTATGGGTNVQFNWQFGDGSTATGNPVTHTYLAIGVYPVTVTVSNSADSVSANTVATINRSTVYLPLVNNRYVAAPDLIVQRISATANAMQVVIKNQGDRPVENEFWVDVYINPTTAPTQVNQTWPTLGTQGLVWGVTADAFPALAPGGVLTLTVNDSYFWPSLSNVSWPLSVGTPVYAQVDSADAATTYGAVEENHEIVGGTYNNIRGPVFVTTTIVNQMPDLPVVRSWPASPFDRWPIRPQAPNGSR